MSLIPLLVSNQLDRQFARARGNIWPSSVGRARGSRPAAGRARQSQSSESLACGGRVERLIKASCSRVCPHPSPGPRPAARRRAPVQRPVPSHKEQASGKRDNAADKQRPNCPARRRPAENKVPLLCTWSRLFAYANARRRRLRDRVASASRRGDGGARWPPAHLALRLVDRGARRRASS